MRQGHSGTCFDTLVHTSIVAFEVFSRGIGSYPDTKLPWNVEEDMRIFESYFFNPGYFPICGYNTYKAMPSSMRSIVGVIGSRGSISSISEAIDIASDTNTKVLVCGGESLYKEAAGDKRIAKFVENILVFKKQLGVEMNRFYTSPTWEDDCNFYSKLKLIDFKDGVILNAVHVRSDPIEQC